MDRPYDIVLFGASGFTGALTAAYLAEFAGPAVTWAMAGRNRTKMEALGIDVPIMYADAADPASLAELAARARVVVTTVGPYIRYGEPLVAACAEAGTHYLDLTGEPEFVDRMYLRHHATAVRTGARLVHACGFDSIPFDLGVLFTVEQLPEHVPLTVSGFLRVHGSASGGTFHSAVSILARRRHGSEAAALRRTTEPAPAGRRVSAGPGGLRYVGGWALPMPTVDPRIVGHSARLLDRYGPDFTYRQHYAVRRLPTALTMAGGAAALAALARIPPARDRLLTRLRPGDGPSPEQRARNWFKVTFVGEGGGRRVVTEVAGGDPGYGETAKMLAESALCLAFDDVPDRAGQLTTAAALGRPLIDRLQRAGLTFTVRDRTRP
ncbi:saccharopine dehydrogenase NADP-binding domain-containing protein [Nonomuraea glycinis]|uniref:Saccharopine dehydrogenase n=1 Tax=Nonomuraea glycinis TaxID=2047744 RepID=A0A918E9M7_9ACTN|nr:saccharopine dehydrogenase NADP-binding domain-containing protein [Nonomuraea glycinis]MCA2182857.1 saccharopine dehydrogenase NADP-binding domain-containing protein [Nonomuraea glycinis]GGP17365.1 saccharopine dehydrogenase [Nonomuraea glycinis]